MVEEGIYPEDAIDDAIDHFCRVNKTTRAVFERHLDAALVEYDRLSKLSWRIDWGSYAHMIDDVALARLGLSKSTDSRVIAR